MRASWWAGLFAVVLICAVAYRHFTEPGMPAAPLAPSAQPEWPPRAQEQVLPLAYADEDRADEARIDEARVDAGQVEGVASASVAPEQASAVPESSPSVPEPASAASISAQSPVPQEAAQLEPAPATVTIARVEPTDTPPDLSYLHFYAYSEIPPEPKPAVTVLDALKVVPRGTPLDEIRRVSDLLRLDFNFMKTVAKIESGFDPKQRTGSYIGLFQLSKKEFDMYGSGDILDPRDNTVAAALKFMTENIMFEMFMHREPSFNDIYLIHQQGVEGAVEHLTQPRRLAWRSMCATYEGKEKGEKWCKRAIWGNTLPAVKRIWKSVNRVTSADFVGMWRQRVAEFYTQYSKSAAK